MSNETRTQSGIIVPEAQQPVQARLSRRELLKITAQVITGAAGLYVAKSLEPFVDMVDAATSAKIIRVEKGEAPGRYGWDYWSNQDENWTYNKDGTATLNQDPSGAVHRVRTNGAIIRGIIKPDPYTGKLIRTVVLPRNVGYVDGNRMIFTLVPENRRVAEFNRELAKERSLARSNEVVAPILLPLINETATVESSQLLAYSSPEEAMNELGNPDDPETMIVDYYRINEYGGVEFNPDRPDAPHGPNYVPGATHFMKAPKNVVWDSWVRVKRIHKVNGRDEVLEGFQAIAFNGHPLGPNEFLEMPLTSGTSWRVPDPNEPGISQAEAAHRFKVAQQLRFQVYRQQIAREQTGRDGKPPEQPGVLVLPIDN